MHEAQITGEEHGIRLESRIIEERIQEAVRNGSRQLTINAKGQHGLGGRLWVSQTEPIAITITGSPGQRLGSMGAAGTTITAHGPASDDVGWLNAGAQITVLGHAGNGVCNAMAQGRVHIGGSIGSRGMTMTKQNPRFSPPELWVLGGVGDYFAEFMAGGVAVVCGVEPFDPENILGYRPCVGMVGGKIFFRGPHQGFSTADAKLAPIEDTDWQWLTENLRTYLADINHPELFETLTQRDEWQLLAARSPFEKIGRKRRSMTAFRNEIWDQELGRGGLIGDLSQTDRSPIPLIATGELRRFVPVWENRKYLPPCQASCPTGIPVQKRWELIRAGKISEAIDLAMAYTPFPATVCGHLCPHLCMEACTKLQGNLPAVDITELGKAGLQASLPQWPASSGHRVAIIGGGPAGISLGWQLLQAGHEPIIFDRQKRLGGKITSAIPNTRIPAEILEAELERAATVLPHVHLEQDMTQETFEAIKREHDLVAVAIGAQRPRTLPIPGNEHLVPALDFLQAAKKNTAEVGAQVVIIGAGNVGCDVATEASRLGAEDILLIDIQEPASFGEERRAAERVGARFRYPCYTHSITPEGVKLHNGETIPADTVIVSIGDQPELDFLPENIATERGYIKVNSAHQTSDAQVFALGDIVKPGLLTDAIGAGRQTALAMDAIFRGRRPLGDTSEMPYADDLSLDYLDPEQPGSEVIDYSRMTLAYFDPRTTDFESLDQCAAECASCGACRDCGLCIEICPQIAIFRRQLDGEDFEMVADPEKCIGCGFCAQACPCGIWALHPNDPLI
ncbi:MAG: FAD-dependent oxidoreductase [Thermodesulfobacteriota bacterium]